MPSAPAGVEGRLRALAAKFPQLPKTAVLQTLKAFNGHEGRAAAYLQANIPADEGDILANLPLARHQDSNTSGGGDAGKGAASIDSLANHSTPWCVRTRNGCVVCNAGRRVTNAVQSFLRRLHGRQRLCLLAAELDRVTAVKFFVEGVGLNPNCLSFCVRRAPPLVLAAECGSSSVSQYLANNRRVDITLRDKYGHTALAYSARNGHARVCSALVNAYVDRLRASEELEARHRDFEEALGEAARFGNSYIVAVLVEAGATTTRFQEVEFAVECGLAAMVRDLHFAGARVRSQRMQKLCLFLTHTADFEMLCLLSPGGRYYRRNARICTSTRDGVSKVQSCATEENLAASTAATLLELYKVSLTELSSHFYAARTFSAQVGAGDPTYHRTQSRAEKGTSSRDVQGATDNQWLRLDERGQPQRCYWCWYQIHPSFQAVVPPSAATNAQRSVSQTMGTSQGKRGPLRTSSAPTSDIEEKLIDMFSAHKLLHDTNANYVHDAGENAPTSPKLMRLQFINPAALVEAIEQILHLIVAAPASEALLGGTPLHNLFSELFVGDSSFAGGADVAAYINATNSMLYPGCRRVAAALAHRLSARSRIVEHRRRWECEKELRMKRRRELLPPQTEFQLLEEMERARTEMTLFDEWMTCWELDFFAMPGEQQNISSLPFPVAGWDVVLHVRDFLCHAQREVAALHLHRQRTIIGFAANGSIDKLIAACRLPATDVNRLVMFPLIFPFIDPVRTIKGSFFEYVCNLKHTDILFQPLSCHFCFWFSQFAFRTYRGIRYNDESLEEVDKRVWFARTSAEVASKFADAKAAHEKAPAEEIFCSALMVAALHGRAAVVDVLLSDFNANCSVQDANAFDGGHALMIAASWGRIGAVMKFVRPDRRSSCGLRLTNCHGRTALHEAALYGHAEVCASCALCVCVQCARLPPTSEGNGQFLSWWMRVHALCRVVGRTQVVRLLIAAKCPVDWRARDGRTALLDAVATSIGSGDTLCTRMLVSAKADCTISPRGGPSPLQVRAAGLTCSCQVVIALHF